MSRDGMTASAVAKRLGVSRSRVYQLVRTGQLPAPRVVDARTRVWDETDVATFAARREGRTVSGLASALSAAHAPLPRVQDEVVECALPPESMLGVASVSLHLRVWDGPAPEGRRVVVVIGYLSDDLPPTVEQASGDIARRWLPVPEMDAVWFRYRPDTHGDLGPLTNIVLEWPAPEETSAAAQFRPWLVSRGRGRGQPPAPRRPRSTRRSFTRRCAP